MRLFAVVAGIVTLLAGPVAAQPDRAGDFDYYVMALSWSSNWCALEGDARGEDQCLPGRDLGFTLHGLWPQHETGWPEWCRTGQRDPSRRESAAMADIMGSGGLAWYQWKKHGRCSGLPPQDYFALSRDAFDAVRMPEVFSKVTQDLELPARVIEDAFLEADPRLTRDMVTVTCRAGLVQEVRICLTRDLEPRDCGRDVRRDCTLPDAGLNALR
ncbi:ribonuclease T2 family protein [Szabonella alba]|uniref:Ribonuclease T2 n=1 Tax=Szabonella alba TaxID=2804194 RepID=A0A8K0Y1I4_9RHOB|nr:ribonuclease T2 [Szabonella alba]MBL4916054.1 ribonuclease T2 [Szabonella alba]